LGDSKAILHNSESGCQFLTTDHRPSDPIEKERILAIPGAFIENGRLNGKLQVSRALGDSSLHPFVSHVPDVKYTEIDSVIIGFYLSMISL
jgi:serine/threonine protein phosphatase PrpC